MDRVTLRPGAAPIETIADLLGSPVTGLSVWGGKRSKTGKRVFVHAETCDGRLWFAKVSREGSDGLRAEYEAMRYVQAMLEGTPYHEGCRQRVEYHDGVLVQEWRTGFSLRDRLISSGSRAFQRGRIARACAAITDWLAGFHALGASDGSAPRSLTHRGATHGDFKPTNILLRGDALAAIVDWELFDPRGVQIYDILHFLLYVGMTLTAPDRVKGIRLTLFEQSWISEIARVCLARYLAALRCDSGSLTSVLGHYIDAMLDRRAALGLSNADSFLLDARTLLSHWDGMPYAFQRLETTSVAP